MSRAALSLAGMAAMSLTACGDIGMDRQAKALPQSTQALRYNGAAAPDGVVAVGEPAREADALKPPLVTLALVQRGRERHAIACAPCHGAQGDGDGAAVRRGFPRPAPYAPAHNLSGAQLYAVISGGYGIMLPQADRLSPQDRWAVIAYVRALQLAPPAGSKPAGGRS